MRNALGAMVATAIGLLSFWPGSAAAAVEEWATGLWDTSTVPAIPNWPDAAAGTTGVELGTSFESSTEVWVVGVRFYKGDLNTGEHQGSLWLPGGELVASGTFANETADGWQDLLFDQPVLATPGQVYVASYYSPTANYSAENEYFLEPLTVGPITAHAGANGVYQYGDTSAFPEFSYRSSNYWVTPLWVTSLTPEVDAGAPAAGTEGEPILLTGSAADPDGDDLTLTWDVVSGPADGGSCTIADPTVLATSITCDDDGEVVVSLTADDATNPPVVDTNVVTVANAAPTMTLTASNGGAGSAQSIADGLIVAVTLADPGANDSHTCSIDWGDGTSDSTPATDGACDASHSYEGADEYTVTALVTDDDGAAVSSTATVVVYDPTGRAVFGWGAITSPAGAYTEDPSATGRAWFSLQAVYCNWSPTPIGHAGFVFRAGSFRFRADTLDWLVAGDDTARVRGTGTVNGVGGHEYEVWVEDGSPDTFRLKVWTVAADGGEQVVYDSGAAPVRRGLVVVHDVFHHYPW